MTLSIYAGKSILVVNLLEVHSLSSATQRLLTWMTTALIVRRVYKTFRLSLWKISGKISGAWPRLFLRHMRYWLDKNVPICDFPALYLASSVKTFDISESPHCPVNHLLYFRMAWFHISTHRQLSVSYFKLSITRHAEAVDLDDYRTRCAVYL